MKNKKILAIAIRIKRRTILAICGFGLVLAASVSGGVIELLADTYFNILASNTELDAPLAERYELQTQPPYVVALDAGHGNFDVGARGIVKELVVIENTADELFELLSADKNYKPVMTRQKDEEIKPAERARRAIDAKASIFLSIHANADHSSGASGGFECYPTPPGRYYSEQSMKLAQRIVANMAMEDHKIRGENGIKFAYYSGKSKRMVDSSNNKVRSQKSFGVVEKPLCPSVLVEQCFITSKKDVEKWGSEKGCKKAAQVYYTAICEYFGTQPIKIDNR